VKKDYIINARIEKLKFEEIKSKGMTIAIKKIGRQRVSLNY